MISAAVSYVNETGGQEGTGKGRVSWVVVLDSLVVPGMRQARREKKNQGGMKMFRATIWEAREQVGQCTSAYPCH